MMKAKVELKFTTLTSGTKSTAIVPLEVEVNGANIPDLTPQQIAVTHALDYFIKNYVISENDVIEVKLVTIL